MTLRFATRLFAALALLASTAVCAQPTPAAAPLDIRLEHDTEAERTTADELRAVVAAYDVEEWIVTREVRIDASAIPHSHPVLTLHTRHNGQPLHLLSTFLHEQFHWWVMERPDELLAATTAFRRAWPEVPVGGGEGGRDEESTYLHLVVCHLEYQAMAALVGADEARAILESNNHYRWIYDRVLNDPQVDRTVRGAGLSVDEGR
ncbi:hypothetical protein WI460_04170 [Gemmatimonadota bacterium Y43]|uniref:hypothetical protein n=1 Tax=Gaopeijia maritima TaxID=3119007 RepID=UPI00329287BE